MQLIVAKEKRVRIKFHEHHNQLVPAGTDADRFREHILNSPGLSQEQKEDALSGFFEDTVLMPSN